MTTQQRARRPRTRPAAAATGAAGSSDAVRRDGAAGSSDAVRRDGATASPRSGYHHGDLREVLIDLGTAHIAEVGMEKLSLRALARAAGVSPTAPYRHFPTRQCLLAGIAIRGFRRLSAQMDAALQQDAPFEQRFVALGRAYIEHAVADPVAYQLMFGGMVDFSRYPNLREAADASFGRLLQALEQNAPLERLAMSASQLAAIVWAGVHGIASLLISDVRQRAQRDETDLAAQSIETLARDPGRALEVMYLHWFKPQ